MNRPPKSLTDSPPPSDNLNNSNAFVEEESEFDPREQLEVFWRRRWAILAVLLATTILGTLYTITRKPIFVATTKLALQSDSKSTPSPDQFIDALGMDPDRNVETQVEIMKGPDFLDKAYNVLDPKQRDRGFLSQTIPTWCYSIDSTTNSNIVSITVKSYSARISAALANSIADTYLDQDLNRNNASTKQAREFVEGARDKAKVSLTEASWELTAYREKKNLAAPDAQVADAANQVFALHTAIDAATSTLAADQSALANIAAKIRAAKGTLPSSETVQENPAFAKIRENISTLRSKLNEMSNEYVSTSPEITDLKNTIAAEEERLRVTAKKVPFQSTETRNPLLDELNAKYVEASVDSDIQSARLRSASTALARRETELAKYPEQQRRLAELQLRVDILLTSYKALDEKYNDLLVQEQSTLPTGIIAARARPPLFPSYPQKTQGVIGSLLAGLLLGAMFAKLLERFDTRVHDPVTVDRITGRSVLTVVPEVAPDKLAPTQQVLIGMVDNNHAFLESFRLLRNNIMFSAPDQTLRVISVTSAGKGEGKSTTSVNLAISMAMDGRKVLLIDGDLRRPTVHNYLNISRDIGFTNVVKGLTPLDQAVVKTEFENVYCLPAGPLPPNPTEFLNSKQARRLIEEAKDKYDVVIIDSPPCTGLSDVQVISTLVDGLVLVVALEATQKQYLVATMRLLRQAGAPLLGTVINRVQHKRHAYGYYSYYYGYGYAYAYAYSYSYQEDDQPDKKKRKRRKAKKSE